MPNNPVVKRATRATNLAQKAQRLRYGRLGQFMTTDVLVIFHQNFVRVQWAIPQQYQYCKYFVADRNGIQIQYPGQLPVGRRQYILGVYVIVYQVLFAWTRHQIHKHRIGQHQFQRQIIARVRNVYIRKVLFVPQIQTVNINLGHLVQRVQNLGINTEYFIVGHIVVDVFKQCFFWTVFIRFQMRVLICVGLCAWHRNAV